MEEQKTNRRASDVYGVNTGEKARSNFLTIRAAQRHPCPHPFPLVATVGLNISESPAFDITCPYMQIPLDRVFCTRYIRSYRESTCMVMNWRLI
jgi:hypothetical protein